MRYVKLVGDEPGRRFDLLMGRSVFSTRFLSEEEHMLTGRVEDAWATVWCWIFALPTLLRSKILPMVRDVFALLGLGYTIAIVLDWYLRARGQR